MAAERDALKKQVGRTGGAARKEQLKRLVASLEAKVADHRRKTRAQHEADALRAKQRADARAGKGPYFEKASDKRKRELVERYNALKKSGKLTTFMAKRRQRVAAKDRRIMPSVRRGE